MIVSNIIQLILRQLQKVISLSAISLFVLSSEAEEKDSTDDTTEQEKPERSPIASQVSRCLTCDKDVTSHDASAITKSNLNSTAKGAFVVTAHVIGQPDYEDWLNHYSPCDDEGDSQVFDTYRQATLTEKNYVSDCRNGDAENGKTVAVAETVTCPGCGECKGRGYNVHRDGVQLRLCRRVTKLMKNGRNEGGDGIARGGQTEIHQGA